MYPSHYTHHSAISLRPCTLLTQNVATEFLFLLATLKQEEMSTNDDDGIMKVDGAGSAGGDVKSDDGRGGRKIITRDHRFNVVRINECS